MLKELNSIIINGCSLENLLKRKEISFFAIIKKTKGNKSIENCALLVGAIAIYLAKADKITRTIPVEYVLQILIRDKICIKCKEPEHDLLFELVPKAVIINTDINKYKLTDMENIINNSNVKDNINDKLLNPNSVLCNMFYLAFIIRDLIQLFKSVSIPITYSKNPLSYHLCHLKKYKNYKDHSIPLDIMANFCLPKNVENTQKVDESVHAHTDASSVDVFSDLFSTLTVLNNKNIVYASADQSYVMPYLNTFQHEYILNQYLLQNESYNKYNTE